MKELEYRKLTKCDAPQVRLLSDFARTNTRPDFLSAYRNEDSETIFNEKLHSHFVAVYGEEIAGILRYINNQDLLEYDKGILKMKDSQRLCKFGGALVLPEFRDKGVIQGLMEMASEEALENGCGLALARVHPENKASIQALERASFNIATTDYNERKTPRHFFTKPLDYTTEK